MRVCSITQNILNNVSNWRKSEPKEQKRVICSHKCSSSSDLWGNLSTVEKKSHHYDTSSDYIRQNAFPRLLFLHSPWNMTCLCDVDHRIEASPHRQAHPSCNDTSGIHLGDILWYHHLFFQELLDGSIVWRILKEE